VKTPQFHQQPHVNIPHPVQHQERKAPTCKMVRGVCVN
jgi:hypothetical protein